MHSHKFLYNYEALLVKEDIFLWELKRLKSEICILLKHAC